MVNGRKYDWESVEIKLPQGTAIGITEVSYSDEKGLEARYGKGATRAGMAARTIKDRAV